MNSILSWHLTSSSEDVCPIKRMGKLPALANQLTENRNGVWSWSEVFNWWPYGCAPVDVVKQKVETKH